MSRHKAPSDPRGGHVRFYWDMLDSPAFQALGHADVRVCLMLRRKLGATNNGNLNATLSEAKHAGITSSSTLAHALQRLEALGLIAKTRQGGATYGGRKCSLYRFTDVEMYAHPKLELAAQKPTNDWRAFKTLADAKAAIKHIGVKNKIGSRLSNVDASTIEAVSGFTASIIERKPVSKLRQSNVKQTPKIELQAA